MLIGAGFVRKSVGDTVYFESADRDVNDPIVLVHGVNDHAGTWFTVAPALAATRRVILPDLGGHGESAPSHGPLPISLLIEQLDAVIGHERNITLVGNSLGGWLATLYTLAHPDRVKHLVLEAAGGLDRPFASPLYAFDREQAIVILNNVHGPRFVAPDWVIDALIARSTDSQMLRVTETESHKLDGRLSELHTPTSLIWGADDGVLPVAYGQELQSLIAGSELHVLDGAAHIPHMQQPEKFLQCLTAIS
ncbi:MAG TPA: alpha/beta fold hydrolase [Thermoanaerobaculia bacterium]